MAYDYAISPIRNNLTIHKPHVWVRYGVWHASSAGAKGEGMTQREAYRAWQRAERKAAIKRRNRPDYRR